MLSQSGAEFLVLGIIIPFFAMINLILLLRWVISINKNPTTTTGTYDLDSSLGIDLMYHLETEKQQCKEGKYEIGKCLPCASCAPIVIIPTKLMVAVVPLVAFLLMDYFYMANYIYPYYQTEAIVLGHEVSIVDHTWWENSYSAISRLIQDDDGSSLIYDGDEQYIDSFCVPYHEYSLVVVEWHCPFHLKKCSSTILSWDCGKRDICQEDCLLNFDDGFYDDNYDNSDQYDCIHQDDEEGGNNNNDNNDDNDDMVSQEGMLNCSEATFPINDTIQIVSDCSRCTAITRDEYYYLLHEKEKEKRRANNNNCNNDDDGNGDSSSSSSDSEDGNCNYDDDYTYDDDEINIYKDSLLACYFLITTGILSTLSSVLLFFREYEHKSKKVNIFKKKREERTIDIDGIDEKEINLMNTEEAGEEVTLCMHTMNRNKDRQEEKGTTPRLRWIQSILCRPQKDSFNIWKEEELKTVVNKKGINLMDVVNEEEEETEEEDTDTEEEESILGIYTISNDEDTQEKNATRLLWAQHSETLANALTSEASETSSTVATMLNNDDDSVASFTQPLTSTGDDSPNNSITTTTTTTQQLNNNDDNNNIAPVRTTETTQHNNNNTYIV